jgi:hypothetical protein
MEKDIRDARCPKCQYVFHHNGHPIVDYLKAWASACERTAVPGLLFHDLWRSAIRNLRLAGIPENVAMEISRYRSRSVFDRYSIVGDKDLIRSWATKTFVTPPKKWKSGPHQPGRDTSDWHTLAHTGRFNRNASGRRGPVHRP